MADSIISRIGRRLLRKISTAGGHDTTNRSAETLSREDLALLRKGLSAMSPAALKEFYRRAHGRCSLEGDSVPKPSDIQGLVQAWRQMRDSAQESDGETSVRQNRPSYLS